LSPSPEQVVPWATAIKLTSPKQVQKVSDFSAEGMGSFSGGFIAYLEPGKRQDRAIIQGRRRWYYDFGVVATTQIGSAVAYRQMFDSRQFTRYMR
jgi:hypothetical protein